MRKLGIWLVATIAFAAMAPAALAGYSSILSTPKHVVVIVVTCPEGDLDCVSVTYTGVDKRSGAAITLKGEDWVRHCADGVTPCQHLGWQFPNGGTIYRVSDDGVLTVTEKGKALLEEKGSWVSDR